MSTSLESALSTKKNILNMESVLSFLPVKVTFNLAKIAFFPVYFGVALIDNGARDENEHLLLLYRGLQRLARVQDS